MHVSTASRQISSPPLRDPAPLERNPGPIGPAAAVVIAVVSLYKSLISPLFTGCCRFTPSCSDYMVEAVRLHGVWRGVRLGLQRLGRCRPMGTYGIDPVPHD